MVGSDDGESGATSLELPDGSTEDATERDGAFSYAGEWHAFTIGVYRGLVTYKPWSDDFDEVAAEYDDVDAEPWYYKGGYVVGTLVQVAVLVTIMFVWAWFSP